MSERKKEREKWVIFFISITYFKKSKRKRESVSSLLFNANVSSRFTSHVTHILPSLLIILLLSWPYPLYLSHSFLFFTFSLNSIFILSPNSSIISIVISLLSLLIYHQFFTLPLLYLLSTCSPTFTLSIPSSLLYTYHHFFFSPHRSISKMENALEILKKTPTCLETY